MLMEMESVDSSPRKNMKNYVKPLKDVIITEKCYYFEWIVPDFKKLISNVSLKEYGASADIGQTKLQLNMQFLGRNNDMIEIYYLCPSLVFSKISLSTFMRTSLSLGYEKREVYSKEFAVYQPSNKWQHLFTFYRKDLQNGYLDEYNRINSSLYLRFRFTVSDNVTQPEPQLSYDFKNLLQNSLFSDAIVKSADGQQFNVHKAVLASRSPVFKEQFENNFNYEDAVETIDSHLESAVLNEVLNFIYSDKANVNKIPQKILGAADYYRLDKLKSLCEEALNTKLSLANAIDTLQLADLHSANNLKQLTLDFIKDGQAKLITKTEAWADISSVDLVKSIYEHIV